MVERERNRRSFVGKFSRNTLTRRAVSDGEMRYADDARPAAPLTAGEGEGHLEHATLLMRQGEFDSAIGLLREALRGKPGDVATKALLVEVTAAVALCVTSQALTVLALGWLSRLCFGARSVGLTLLIAALYPNLAFGAQTLKLPIDNETFRLLTLPGVDIIRRTLVDFDRNKGVTADNIPHVLTEVSKVQLGGVRFVGVPGELLPELAVGFDAEYAFGGPVIDPANPAPPDLSKAPAGPYLKSKLGGEKPVVLGLANDENGYLVPDYDFKLHPTKPYSEQATGDHYEETYSLGPEVEAHVVYPLLQLVGWRP